MNRLMVSMDLDDAWAYQRARGMTGWDSTRTLLPQATDAAVSVLDSAGIREVTMFAVGRDADTLVGARLLRELSDNGYEIANHSWMHRGELPGLDLETISKDLDDTSVAIQAATGAPVYGFRCPSFGSSPSLAEALQSLGYAYDASVFPTILMPALRAYHRVVAGRGETEPTYGSLRTVVASQRIRITPGRPASIPVTTMPLLRLPVHGSYLMVLAERSPGLALTYLRVFDRLARTSRLDVSFLIHPTDVLDSIEAPELGFFPGMGMNRAKKRHVLESALSLLAEGRRSTRTVEAATQVHWGSRFRRASASAADHSQAAQ